MWPGTVSIRTIYSVAGRHKRHGTRDWRRVEAVKSRSKWQIRSKELNKDLVACRTPSSVLGLYTSREFQDRINFITAFHLVGRLRYGPRGTDLLNGHDVDGESLRSLAETCEGHVPYWKPHNLRNGAWALGRIMSDIPSSLEGPSIVGSLEKLGHRISIEATNKIPDFKPHDIPVCTSGLVAAGIKNDEYYGVASERAMRLIGRMLPAYLCDLSWGFGHAGRKEVVEAVLRELDFRLRSMNGPERIAVFKSNGSDLGLLLSSVKATEAVLPDTMTEIAHLYRDKFSPSNNNQVIT